jgi:hypothetical protein
MEVHMRRKTLITAFTMIALLGSGLSTAALARGGGGHIGGAGIGGAHFGGAAMAGARVAGNAIGGAMGHVGGARADGFRTAPGALGRGFHHFNRHDSLGSAYGDYEDCDLPYYQQIDPLVCNDLPPQ